MSFYRSQMMVSNTQAQGQRLVTAFKESTREDAPGLSLDSFLGATDFGERVIASAAAIAWLHKRRNKDLKRYPVESFLSDLEKWAEELAVSRPENRRLFEQQLAILQEKATRLPQYELNPAHGNFSYRKVRFDGSRATLILQNELILADPALDVASFAVSLRLLSLHKLPDPYSLDLAAERFVYEYQRYHPSPGFMQRLAFYEIAGVFKLMFVVLQCQELAQHFEALLETEEHLVHMSD